MRCRLLNSSTALESAVGDSRFQEGMGANGKIGTRLSTIITDLIIPKRVTGMRKLKSGLHLRTADRPQSGRGRIMGRCVRSKSGWAGGRSAADFWMV